MDRPWRMRMGMPPPVSDDPEDFSDVFGGPPRTVLSRHSTAFYYDEILRPSLRLPRTLPEFRIPCDHYHQKRDEDGFYRDVFGWDKSRSRSKTCSSSILSTEELSPLRRAASLDFADDDFPSFASNRPINMSCTWDSTTMKPPFSGNQSFYDTKSEKNASLETISLEPISNSSFGVSADDSDLNLPPSEFCHLSDREKMTREMEDKVLKQDNVEPESESDDDAMSSYVIEINPDYRDVTSESNGIDEAIAWAKEKFQQECKTEKRVEEILSNGHQVSEGNTDSLGSSDEQETQEELTELEILDEKIRLWSTGKEADIRLLLSSLHYILWPNSGWLAISLANIMEISKVKKAYQKARLCLHPDKLQQRGATLRQKYIAEKAFSLLQDAWNVFISRTENFVVV